MTVDELIEKLEPYRGMRVVTSGFDGRDYSDIGEPEAIEIALNVREPGHSGEHEGVNSPATHLLDEYEVCKAVLIDF